MPEPRRSRPDDRFSPEAVLQELRSQRELMEAIALDQRKIRILLRNLQVYTMSLPDLMEQAAVAETEEAAKFHAAYDELQQKLDDLQALHDATPTPGVGEAIVNIKEVADRFRSINQTPFGDIVVSEVIQNDNIDTPAVVEAAPPVSTEVVQDISVVKAALEAIVESDSEE